MSRRVYIAGPYDLLEQLKEEAEKIRKAGHTVVSQWLYDSDRAADCGWTAVKNLEELKKADVFLAYTQPPDTPYSSGGRHFEAGYAARLYQDEVVDYLCYIGPRENVFYHLFVDLSSTEDFLDFLEEEREREYKEDCDYDPDLWGDQHEGFPD